MSRGYFGIGIENPKKEVNVGTLWRSAYCLGANFIFTIGVRYVEQASDTTKSWRHIPYFEFEDVDDFMVHVPYGCSVVGIEVDGTPLKEFDHPDSAIYVLGPEDGSLSGRLQQFSESIVKIDSTYCLNVAVAGSIVMYDRNIKQ